MVAPDWMVINAVRYAVGRMTYVVGETADWLVNNWGGLPPSVRTQIRRDLEKEFERDDFARAAGKADCGLPLGMSVDRQEWERVRRAWGGPAA